MNPPSPTRTPPLTLAALIALAAGASMPAQAADAPTPTFNPQVVLRGLSPQEIKDYGLTNAQGASGMNAIGLGQPAYLEAYVGSAFPSSNLVNVSWSVTTQPIGSKAALEPSPLGANVPMYKPADRLASKLASRSMLRPDVAGQYKVTATFETTTGSTNVSVAISGATYMGANTCALCHSGGIGADNTFSSWSKSPHGTVFTRRIDDGWRTASCITCHVAGWDTNTNAVNGGFDDVMKQVGWTVPAVFTNGNWAAMPSQLKNLANVQCENCHGPGSEHAMALGNTNLSNWPRIGITYASGNCAQCHDSLSHHYRSAEWNNSGHAIAPRQTSAGCARCHTASGYANFVDKGLNTATGYEAITCATCHEPHDASNPHQLRSLKNITLSDNKTIASTNNLGMGLVCVTCHMTRRDAATYAANNAASSTFGPHYGSQGDMLLGVNGFTYGKTIPSSAHREVVKDSCVECHMQEHAVHSGPDFTKVGGHTFKMSWDSGTNVYEMDEACVECHGPIPSFNFARQDYDGNGVVDGVQTEVKGLLTKLATMLPPVGVVKTNHGHGVFSPNASWTRAQLKAVYNYFFVTYDGSFGIHNLSYAVGLLKASIADLTGDSNNDGLPDEWQINYFGSALAPEAAPSYSAAGDGVPNWLKYSLGLDPKQKGISVTDGVVWARGNALINPPGDTNSVKIYTAAEVTFPTEAGKSYQLQAITSLGGGWMNIGSPIVGNGQAQSYVTPTRSNVQQFYRLIVTP